MQTSRRKSFTAYADSAAECQAWVEAFNTAICNAEDAEVDDHNDPSDEEGDASVVE